MSRVVDTTFLVSLVTALLGAAATYYGVPIEDPVYQEIVNGVLAGVTGLAAALAALRAYVVTRGH